MTETSNSIARFHARETALSLRQVGFVRPSIGLHIAISLCNLLQFANCQFRHSPPFVILRHPKRLFDCLFTTVVCKLITLLFI